MARQREHSCAPPTRSQSSRGAASSVARRIRMSRVQKRGATSSAKKGTRLRRVLRYVGYAALVGGVAGFLFVASLFAWYSRDLPSVDQLSSARVAQSTEILDRNGAVLYRLHGDENRTIVALDEIPLHLQQATITIEDQDFYSHPGFDAKATFRSALAHTGILGSSYYRGGGSTITQQLIKNTVVGNDPTITRKIKELILSFELERKIEKDEILGLYLNQISYGSQAYGVEAAANRYFGKHVSEISLSEAAVLAAIPQASTRLSPHGTHLDQLTRRKELVLDRMVEQGYITEDEAAEAKADDVLARVQPPRESIKAPHFVFHVLEVLEERYGSDALQHNGYRVTTTLDLHEQEIAEEVVAKYSGENLEKYNANNMALVSIEPTDGTVRAMVGSTDYYNTDIDGQVNVATSPRQPGSSFKPLVYLRGFEKGYTPNTLLMDVTTDFGGGYQPKNYSGGQSGPVTVRRALGSSLNIPAVKMAYLVGVDDLKEFARELGYTNFVGETQVGLSIGLGSHEISLLNHTGAYAMMSQSGVAKGEYSRNVLLKVEQGGETIFEYEPTDEQLFDADSAKMLTGVLSDDGNKIGANLKIGRPAAAKTGTTNDNFDAWTMGYTPQRAVGVWTGNTDHSETRNNLTGLFGAAPAWNEFMSRVHTGLPVENFSLIDTPNTGKNILDGRFEVEKVRVCKADGGLANEQTPESQVEEKEFQVVHSILYFINKRDPRGAAPSNPEQDPQFGSWESAVQRWLEENKDNEDAKYAAAPTEECAAHSPELQPTVTIISPTNAGTYAPGETFFFRQVATLPLPARQVDFFIDDTLIATRTAAPFEITYTIPAGLTGTHVMKVVLYDQVDNRAEHAVVINVSDAVPTPVPTPTPTPSATPTPSPTP